MRKDYISWDEYFMSVALLSSKRSKDPSTQVGACIVNQLNHIVGVGYNGFPTGCDDAVFPWAREGEFLDTKYPYVVHAEQNAILNSNATARGSRIYVTLFPCHECSKYIIQAGITELIYMEDKYENTDSIKASKKMLNAAGVLMRQMSKLNVNVKRSEQ